MFLAFVLLLAYFVSGTALAVTVYRRMKGKNRSLRARLGVSFAIIFVVWAIPYGDHTLGKIQFILLCSEDSGLRVFRTVINVEGFRSISGSANTPVQLGYKFFEKITSDGSIIRYEVGDKGQVTEKRKAIPRSRYLVGRKETNISLQIIRIEDVIVDLKNNERLAEFVQYGHRGGWLNRQFGAMHAYHVSCPAQSVNFGKVILDVLRVDSGRTYQ